MRGRVFQRFDESPNFSLEGADREGLLRVLAEKCSQLLITVGARHMFDKFPVRDLVQKMQ